MSAETPSEIIDKENPTFDLSSVPASERDAAWYKYYYRGDDVPQLTFRAVAMGACIGMAMAFSNLYTTLKIGWTFGVAITACVLSYSIWNVFMALGLSKTKMTILENNCMQSTASAAGYGTVGTIATAVGAHLMIFGDAHRLGVLPVTLWVLFVACLGTFLAIPMKRQMINVEQLPFPSGIAAAETLRSLYAHGTEAIKKAHALLWAMGGAGVVGILRAVPMWAELKPKLAGLQTFNKIFGIPDSLPFSWLKIGVKSKGVVLTGTQMNIAFEPSTLLIGAGMIVGLRVSASMLLGACLCYFVMAPYALSLPDWVQQGKHFMGHIEVAVAADQTIAAVKVGRWSLWFGTSLMVMSGLTSFAMSWRSVLRALRGVGSKTESTAQSDALASIEVPTSWMVMGLIPTAIGLVTVSAISFQMNPLLGIVSVAMSFVIALVASRATGETDTTPIGAMGKITQFAYALMARGNVTANLMSAGITAGAAGSTADLLTDLKSGYLLGANPRKQFLAQFIGIFFGTISVIPAWYLLVPNKAALEAFNPPATNMWRAVAEALSHGVHTIPESARYCIAIGGLVGLTLPLIEKAVPENVRKWLPSSMGLGLAFVMPFQNSFSFFIGAVISEIWLRLKRENGEKYIIPIASGVVAGESLAAAAGAIIANFL